MIDMNVVDDTGHSSIAHELHPDVNGSTFSAIRTEGGGGAGFGRNLVTFRNAFHRSRMNVTCRHGKGTGRNRAMFFHSFIHSALFGAC
jgi:hypothetical protein